MGTLVAFIQSLGGWATGFALVFAVVWWVLKDLPGNAADRGWWVAKLRHDSFSRRYRETLAAALDWLDARLSPGFPDDPALAKTEVSRAWSAPLLALCLLLAVAYPVLSLIVVWAATGESGRVGGLTALPAEGRVWVRVAAIGGLVGVGLATIMAARAKSTLPQLAWLLVAGGLAVAVAFAVAGAFAGAFAVAVAFAVAMQWLGARTGRPALLLALYAALALAALSGAVLVVDWVDDEGRTLLLFVGFLPLLNAAADFASTGLTRWWLRAGLRRGLVAHALRDAAAALGILIALGFALIATVRWATPRDGTPLIDLAGLFADLRVNPGDYYWLYFCFFSTLLPTALHLGVGCFGLFTLWSKRLGRPIADWLRDAEAGSMRAKKAVVALSLCVTGAILAPFAALYGLFAAAGAPILDALLRVFEGWARLIGALPPG